MFTISQLIDAVEQISRLERRAGPMRLAVREGADPDKLHALNAKITQLRASLPAEEHSFMDTIRFVANYRINHDDKVLELQAIEKKIAAALEVAKTQSWKWANRKDGPKEPPEVTALRDRYAAIDAEIETMDENINPMLRLLKTQEAAEADMAAVAGWAARGFIDRPPACIEHDREVFQKEMMAGCERLRLPKVRSCIVVV
jgi:hypothetical protein